MSGARRRAGLVVCSVVLIAPIVSACNAIPPFWGDRNYWVAIENTCATLVEVKLYPNASPAAYTEWDWVPAVPIPVGESATVDAGVDDSTQVLAVRQVGGPWTTAGAIEVTGVPSPEPVAIDPAACPGAPDPFDPAAIIARVPILEGADRVEWYGGYASDPNGGGPDGPDYFLHAVLDASPEMIDRLTSGFEMTEWLVRPSVDERLASRIPESPLLRSLDRERSLKPEGWIAELYFAPDQGIIVLILFSARPY